MIREKTKKTTIGSMLKDLTGAKDEKKRQELLQEVMLTCVAHPEYKLFEALIEKAYKGEKQLIVKASAPPPNLEMEGIKVQLELGNIVFSW